MTTVESVNLPKIGASTNDPELEAVRRHIAFAARQYFPELRRDFQIRCSFPYHSTYPIALFRLHDGVCRRGIVAKWAPVFHDNNEGLTEFTNYQRFNSAVGGDAAFRCPRALDFLAQRNVLLTEEEPGTTLRYVLCHPLRTHGMPGTNLGPTLRALGGWLSAFHAFDSTLVGTGSAAAHLQRATPFLSGDFANRWEVSALLGSDAVQQLQRARNLAGNLKLPDSIGFGCLHNDYGPGNVVVSRQRVTVLDVAWNRPGLQLSDVAYFATVISLMGALRLRSQRWSRFAVTQFVSGYFGDRPLSPDMKLLLALLKTDAILRELERHIRRISQLPPLWRPAVTQLCRHVYRGEIAATTLEAGLKRG